MTDDMKMNMKLYLDAWYQFQEAKDRLEELKIKIIPKMTDESQVVQSHVISLQQRPVFTNVTLDEARKFDAVKKVVNTTKLNAELKNGAQIKGVTFTKYLSVRSL